MKKMMIALVAMFVTTMSAMAQVDGNNGQFSFKERIYSAPLLFGRPVASKL